jgi:hypothetical protein
MGGRTFRWLDSRVLASRSEAIVFLSDSLLHLQQGQFNREAAIVIQRAISEIGGAR